MEYIKSKDIFLLMRDVLKLIHPRPMAHGSRVAYMVYLMLRERGKYEEFELADMVMVATMHDIGAYMTEAGKINDVLRYEGKESMAHSIYGYLFFRYLSPVSELSKAIMYHHMDYDKLKNVDYAYKDLAAYINIAEKMDIYSTSMGNQFDMHMFQKQAGTKLSTDGLYIFYECAQKYNIFEKIASGEYKKELDEIVEYMIFNNEDKKKFLEMLMYCRGFKNKGMVLDSATTACVCDDLAESLMLPRQEREILYYGALLHDIGMLAIPREIIEAPRKLTPEETKLLRTHVEIAAKVYKGRVDDEIVRIAVSHHERCDGSGYPKRLRDIQMNMAQRILQVADVVTALVNERSYRSLLPKEKVISILTEEASRNRLKQQVVITFVKSYDQIMQHVRSESAEILKMYETLNMQYGLISKKYKI
ncbi:MAG: HD domain-containing protein [Lachnospiraceae bacterium]|nr:HD domain-containing protein [Lachnospiraceae bacterium]